MNKKLKEIYKCMQFADGAFTNRFFRKRDAERFMKMGLIEQCGTGFEVDGDGSSISDKERPIYRLTKKGLKALEGEK